MGNHIVKPYWYEIGHKSGNVTHTESNVEMGTVLDSLRAGAESLELGVVIIIVKELEYIKQHKGDHE